MLEMRRGRSPEQKRALLAAVHESLRTAFKIPAHDRTQRVVDYLPEDFEIPPGKTDAYTLVTITAFPGRSIEAKRALYRGIVERFDVIGVAPTDVFIVMHEVPLENWAMRGGVPASDLDLGFSLKV